VVAQDLDGDGDIDLAFARPDRFPAVFENDGAGNFSDLGRADPLPHAPQRPAFVLAAIDLNDDGLPELLLAGPNYLLRAANLGGLVFGPFETLYDVPEYPWSCFSSMGWGDADGDGDLDVMLAGLFGVPHEGWSETANDEGPWAEGSHNVLLLADGDAFTPHSSDLGPAPSPSLSFLTTFTDRDGDGDQDLLIAADRALLPWWPGGSFYRNDGPGADGLPQLVEESGELMFPGDVSAMGLASFDFNEDGLLDYCMTDYARHIPCFLSDPSGGYVNLSLTTGLVPDLSGFPPAEELAGDWVPWSIAAVDLDNDGLRDFAVAAGPPPNFGSVGLTVAHPDHPNALWRGTGVAQFEDRSAASDFRSTQADYGLVSADFAGDGYRELVTAPWSGAPKLYDNPCGAEAWLEVELVGPAGNREGWGARLEASSGDWRHTEELHNLLGVGQSPSRFHLGLGAMSRVDSLRILWPDGRRTEIEGVPVRRMITAIHPSALD
jgi:hypothetical protein